LDKIQNQISGGLFGLMYNQTLIVLGFNIETPNEALKYKKLQDNFPTEVDLCGLIKFGECSDAEAHLTEIIKDIDITDNPILLKCGADKQLQASIFKHGQLEEIEYEVMGAEELYAEFFFCRLIGEMEVFCADNEKSVHECMVRLRKKLASGNVAFSPQASNVVVTSNSVAGFSDAAKMGELLGAVSGGNAPAKSKKATVATEFEVMRLRLFLKHSKDVGDENVARNAPVVTVDKTNCKNLQFLYWISQTF
jgi:Ufm1-specific protease 2